MLSRHMLIHTAHLRHVHAAAVGALAAVQGLRDGEAERNRLVAVLVLGVLHLRGAQHAQTAFSIR